MIYFSFMKRFHKLSMLGISLLLLNMSNTVLAQRKLVPLDEQAPAETPSNPSSSFDKNDVHKKDKKETDDKNTTKVSWVKRKSKVVVTFTDDP